MSTSPIPAPGRIPRDPTPAPGRVPRDPIGALRRRASAAARTAVRGDRADPAWSRPLLWLVALLAGVLTLWGLTRNGYANPYYAEAAQAASRSWRAWLTNAIDVSGTDSLDKGPLSNMLMGLSGRVLGFSSFSLLAPQALCGVASVVVLHNVVRRTLGPVTAIVAALMLALTPIFVAIGRFDNPDAVLVLAEVCAAWALVRALESGRTRDVLLCGLFVGLAFDAKMLQAYLIVPGLALALLVAGRGSLRRRIAQLAAGGGAMVAVSFAWYAAMMALPVADRPWVGDTADNSWFTLIFADNGVDRVSGAGGPGVGGNLANGGFGGAAGPLRLFNAQIGGQVAWLLPCAAVGLALGLWTRRRAPRTDAARAGYLLWGGWAVVSWAVFSFSRGVLHPYYTSALAPAVAALAAGGLVVLWSATRRSAAAADSGGGRTATGGRATASDRATAGNVGGTTAALATVALAATVLGTTALAVVLLRRTSGFAPWLTPVAIALAALCVLALALAPALRPAGGGARRALTGFAALAGLLAVLAGPASYAIATVGETLTGSNPLGGPGGGASGPAGTAFAGPPGAGSAPLARGAGGPPPGAGGPPGASGLQPGGSGRPGTSRLRAGAAGAGAGLPFELGPGAPAGRLRGGGLVGGAPGFGAANRPVGGGVGAGGSVGAATIKYLEKHQGGARYLVAAVGSGVAGPIALSSGRNVIDMGGFMGADPTPSLAALKRLVATGQLHYVLLASGGRLGAGGAAPGGAVGEGAIPGGVAGASGPGTAATHAAIQARDRWIESHGTAVKVAGQRETGLTLYYLRRGVQR
jgi:4-amino-4-deoxy-L-arabinose transferase-like glycosyltransferase